MHVIRVRNVNQALPEGLRELINRGQPMPSRGGDVIVHPLPVTTVYSSPTERVMFHPERDANPFFHFFEALWMLAGRRDAAFLNRFVRDFGERYSDYEDQEGRRLIHGAYGWRWRRQRSNDPSTDLGFSYRKFDQLHYIVKYLKRHPFGRRAVLSMWDPSTDLSRVDLMKDIPCNTQVYFWNCAARLNMTVTCRSNDIIWGAYGANAVHFSMLQEYLAARIGWEVGTYWQVSNNYHAYKSTFEKVRKLEALSADPPYTLGHACPYTIGVVSPFPMVSVERTWDRDLSLFMEDPTSNGYEDPFFHRVAKPLWFAHEAYKARGDRDRFDKALEILDQCAAGDWKLAARQWILRRRGVPEGD